MIPYPTREEVLIADRKQVYRWFLLLRIPGFSKWNKKSGKFIPDPTVPENAQEILSLIITRWKEFGGTDVGLAREIMTEATHEPPVGSSQTKYTNDARPTPQGV